MGSRAYPRSPRRAYNDPDWERYVLRSRNVHPSDGWHGVWKPVVVRYRNCKVRRSPPLLPPSRSTGVRSMNTDHAASLVGRTEAAVGAFARDTKSQAEGLAPQATATAEHTYGQARDQVRGAAAAVTTSVEKQPLITTSGLPLITLHCHVDAPIQTASSNGGEYGPRNSSLASGRADPDHHYPRAALALTGQEQEHARSSHGRHSRRLCRKQTPS